MKSKKITITAANLNGGAVQTEDPVIQIVSSGLVGGSETANFYPRKLYIDNQTGDDVFFTVLANQTELDEYNADPTNYALVPVPNNTVFFDDKLPQAFKLLVQGTSGAGHTSDLDVILYPYSKATQ